MPSPSTESKKSRNREILFFEQTHQRRLTTCRRQRWLAPVATDAANEYVYVAGLVCRPESAKRCLHLAVVGVQIAQEACGLMRAAFRSRPCRS